ncbi:hypothetical protein [Kribbella italica]|uniref:Uncharacterized protein n=1 Tax=Kribbella italica TaxID=1540520 RepID=A0A7W9MRE0_9ACTN|nr:hypothetical protein [Kribbella italica]MBB5833444.1 hypothetical protein [Kribbella italica]
MHIDNEGEALTTQHIVLDGPDDQLYVTYQGVTLSISLGEMDPELVFHPRPIELDIMTEDDLVLTRHSPRSEPGDGVRIHLDGIEYAQLDRAYLKDN